MQPLLQWNINKYYTLWVCVCSLRYPACYTYAPYCHLWPFRLLSYSSTLSHKGQDFSNKKLFNIKYVLIFSTTLKHFSFKRRIQRDLINMCIVLHAKYPFFLSDFNETWIFSTDFENYSNIKFHENSFGGSQFVPCGRTDEETWRR